MTRHTVATARGLTTVVCISLALIASACATSRPPGSSPQAAPAAPAAPTEKPAPAAPAPPAATQKPAPPAATQKPAATTRRTATSKDGTRIAYDMAGTGPFLMALHGGGYSARSWADRGFVDKLKERFTMITPDQRGIADSGKPTTLE